MHPNSASRLADIVDACAFIQKETAGQSFADYEQNHMLRSAMERSVGIIGARLQRLEQTDPATAARLSDYQQIIDLGEQLAHRYEETDNVQVWDVIRHVLPALRAEVEPLLHEADDQADGAPMLDLTMHPLLEQHLDSIRTLCREFDVCRLEVFGSVMTNRFDPERSDVDFIVEYPPDYEFGPWLTRYFDLKDRLETLLGRPVDLVIASAMRKPRFIESANSTRHQLYAV